MKLDDYFADISHLITKIDYSKLYLLIDYILNTIKNKGIIYIMGNGGSATTATHFANDLCKLTKTKTRKAKVISLTDNIAWFSALANDEGYENVFVQQLDNFLDNKDLVIGISASGNSRNVIKGLELAQNKDILTFALLGFDGGKIKNILKDYVIINTEKGKYGQVEDLHSIICHSIANYIKDKLKRGKS